MIIFRGKEINADNILGYGYCYLDESFEITYSDKPTYRIDKILIEELYILEEAIREVMRDERNN